MSEKHKAAAGQISIRLVLLPGAHGPVFPSMLAKAFILLIDY